MKLTVLAVGSVFDFYHADSLSCPLALLDTAALCFTAGLGKLRHAGRMTT